MIMNFLHIKILAWLLVLTMTVGSTATVSSVTYKPKAVFVNMSAQHVKVANTPPLTQTVTTPSPDRNVSSPQLTTPSPVIVNQLTTASPVVQSPPTAPQSTTSSPVVSNTNKEQVADPDGPTFDQYGNEYAADGTVISYSPTCAPTATIQDPCKLGQCFGYPYGICESNPNQGENGKDD